ncbi:hypothetical protein DESUT3_11810 [Desulfuromonas versatilis]|uniref:DUF3147 family protein n=1 Tax=Desulfuromonas versatilis TaxID=2802975 RepID=A0ABN6DVH1_9BACT|nr:DUF3147 family protein [Desulfuromonas versatilis]BCR04112.1 hypothetical protein DESUT3_11810 [Desulfuromonas versatilis]
MAYYLVKIVLTTLLVVAVSEIAKRSTLLGALLASVPLVSVLALLWLYLETGSTEQVAKLSAGIFWLVLPSLSLFVLLPLLLRQQVGFFWALGASMGVMIALYLLLILLLRQFGVHF